jgi:hypothetical protein
MEMHAIQSKQAAMSSGCIVPTRQLYRRKHFLVRYRQTGQGEGMGWGEIRMSDWLPSPTDQRKLIAACQSK